MPFDRIPAVNEDDEFPPGVLSALGIPVLTDLLATTGLPADAGTAASRGVSPKAARADHVHKHDYTVPAPTDSGMSPGSGMNLIETNSYKQLGMVVLNFLAATTADKVADGTLAVVASGYRPSHTVYGVFAKSTGTDAFSVYLGTDGFLKTNVAIPNGTGIRGQLVFILG